MRKIRTAILGAGFMGRVHTESVRRLGNVEVVAAGAVTAQEASAFARACDIERATGNAHELLTDPNIDVVHICTPNDLHFPMAQEALRSGKHVLCEKPLATSTADARALVKLADETGLVNGVCFTIRAYPQVRNLRSIIAAGEIGEVLVVQGTYSQDWLLYDTDWNWRIETGPSRTFADIGSHWCDLVEFVTGLRITSVCAGLHTFLKTRKRPKGEVETFAGKTSAPQDYTEVPIKTEDFGSMIFELGNARGAMTVSQVSAGRKNRLVIEIYGSKAGITWDAERPDELWIGQRNSPNLISVKDPSLMREDARPFADLPGGHSEGYDDSFKQTMRRFYRRVADRNSPVEYPVFADGLRQMQVLDAVLESSAKRAWVDVAH
ncbi:MAG TPA: Gfo/Idh/MocA family oxidoreductase [Bryobacteraceae bacterium]|nr:Gfo/Idh/MocA family oxidoreductase [Bryobacteraceae bacterium]